MANKLCVYIPTHNRLDSVRYYLDADLEKFKNYCIDVVISDSTPNYDIRDLVEEYNKKGFENLFYRRSNEASSEDIEIAKYKFDAYSPACYKVYSEELELADKYDYIWLCGDGVIIKIDNVINDVIKFMSEGYDIIHFTDMNDMVWGENRVFTDANDFYINDIYHVTLYGATILSKNVIKKMNNSNNLHKYLGSGFLYVMSIFEYCAINDFKAVTCMRQAFSISPYKGHSGWMINNNALEVWGKNWVECNKQLPAIYDESKYKVLKRVSLFNDNLFIWPKMMKHRIVGSFGLQEVKKYKEYIPYVTDTSVFKFYVAALMPKWILKILYWIGKKLK